MSLNSDSKSSLGDPTWEIAQLFPRQGAWSAADYLGLDTNHLIELSDGRLEVLPMPTEQHQRIVAFLYDALKVFIAARNLGILLFAPLRVQLSDGKYREPDLVFLLQANAGKRGERYWRGADLVVEVVSEDDPNRDVIEKRQEYARAGIAEYWIVDPRDMTLTVLTLDEPSGVYAQGATYYPGDIATSYLLAGLAIDVTSVFTRS